MYIRPQLSRHKTSDRNILRAEHMQDAAICSAALEEGNALDRDMQQVVEMIDRIQHNDKLSEQDRDALLEPLKQILDSLKEAYTGQVDQILRVVTDSMRERIGEMEDSCKEREKDVTDARKTVWQTDTVDKERLVTAAAEVAREHHHLLTRSKKDLEALMAASEQQRSRIRNRQK